jgi:hypothetical protein
MTSFRHGHRYLANSGVLQPYLARQTRKPTDVFLKIGPQFRVAAWVLTSGHEVFLNLLGLEVLVLQLS